MSAITNDRLLLALLLALAPSSPSRPALFSARPDRTGSRPRSVCRP